MATSWYYAIDGQQHGPVPAATLKELAENGTLRAEDLVWKEGMADWQPAGDVRGLFPEVATDAVEGGPPPAPAFTKPAYFDDPELRTASPYAPPTTTEPLGIGPEKGRIEIGRIGDAFRLLGDQFGPWLLMVIVFFAISLGASIAIASAFGPNPRGTDLLFQSLAQIVVSIVQLGLTAGLFRAAAIQVRTGSTPVEALFSGFARLPSLILAGLFVTIPAFIAAMAVAVVLFAVIGGVVGFGMNAQAAANNPPEAAFAVTFLFVILFGLGIWFAFAVVFMRFSYAILFIVDRGMPAIRALGASWTMTRGQAFVNFGFQLLAGLASGLGVFLCFVGLVLTYPIFYLAMTLVYFDCAGRAVRDEPLR